MMKLQDRITEWMFDNIMLPADVVVLLGYNEWNELLDELKTGNIYKVMDPEAGDVIRIAGYTLRPAPFPCTGWFSVTKDQYKKLKAASSAFIYRW